jgi:hypothetical protein
MRFVKFIWDRSFASIVSCDLDCFINDSSIVFFCDLDDSTFDRFFFKNLLSNDFFFELPHDELKTLDIDDVFERDEYSTNSFLENDLEISETLNSMSNWMRSSIDCWSIVWSFACWLDDFDFTDRLLSSMSRSLIVISSHSSFSLFNSIVWSIEIFTMFFSFSRVIIESFLL